MNYSWDFSVVWRYTELLYLGALGTAQLGLSALALALPLGLVLAIFRLTKIPVISALSVGFIDLFRASPALVLIIWFYFAFPILIDVDLSPFMAATLAIGLQASAYMAEVFRAGIQSVGRGQWDAAKAIGMSYFVALRYIILPQAVKRMLPVFMTRVAELAKTTALAAVITYGELVYQASEIAARTYRPVETFTVVALMYFTIIFSLGRIARVLERRLAVSD